MESKMKLTKKLDSKYILILGSFFLMLAVALGAFGAHALKEILSEKGMETFKTGVQYHYYHGLGLLILGILQKIYTDLNFEKPALAFTMGILLFSFNCYLYAITSIKAFAMIIPIGGIFFLLGWALVTLKLYRSIK
jgi:uncharacterized membrane protein YgdD (TMEM256/DUF423 family)